MLITDYLRLLLLLPAYSPTYTTGAAFALIKHTSRTQTLVSTARTHEHGVRVSRLIARGLSHHVWKSKQQIFSQRSNKINTYVNKINETAANKVHLLVKTAIYILTYIVGKTARLRTLINRAHRKQTRGAFSTLFLTKAIKGHYWTSVCPWKQNCRHLAQWIPSLCGILNDYSCFNDSRSW